MAVFRCAYILYNPLGHPKEKKTLFFSRYYLFNYPGPIYSYFRCSSNSIICNSMVYRAKRVLFLFAVASFIKKPSRLESSRLVSRIQRRCVYNLLCVFDGPSNFFRIFRASINCSSQRYNFFFRFIITSPIFFLLKNLFYGFLCILSCRGSLASGRGVSVSVRISSGRREDAKPKTCAQLLWHKKSFAWYTFFYFLVNKFYYYCFIIIIILLLLCLVHCV